MEKDIGKITKNDRTDIILRIDDFAGRKGLTIREFVTSDRYTGFTKAGVKIQAADFPKFKEMINSITDDDMGEESDSSEKKTKKSSKVQETLSEKIEDSDEETDEEMPDY